MPRLKKTNFDPYAALSYSNKYNWAFDTFKSNLLVSICSTLDTFPNTIGYVGKYTTIPITLRIVVYINPEVAPAIHTSIVVQRPH